MSKRIYPVDEARIAALTPTTPPGDGAMRPFEAPEYREARARLREQGIDPCKGDAPIENSVAAIYAVLAEHYSRGQAVSSSLRVLLLEREMLLARLLTAERERDVWCEATSAANQRIWELSRASV